MKEEFFSIWNNLVEKDRFINSYVKEIWEKFSLVDMLNNFKKNFIDEIGDFKREFEIIWFFS